MQQIPLTISSEVVIMKRASRSAKNSPSEFWPAADHSYKSCQKRVAAYIRMSSDRQGASPERQWEQISAYATRNGLSISDVYQDLGIGGDDNSRPEFLRMLANAQAGEFDVILIDEPSRLSRTSPLEFIGEVVYPLTKAHVVIESVSAGQVFWNDISGLIMSAVLADRSNSEVKNLSRRVLDGMARSTRASWWNSVPPFGYSLQVKRDRQNHGKVVSRNLVPGNAKHVAAIQWMFSEYAKGKIGVLKIAKQFASWGIVGRKRRGDEQKRPLTPQGIWGMLKNAAYAGDTMWNKRSKGKYCKLIDGKAQFHTRPGRNPESEWIIVRNTHPAIIKRRIFQAVQDRIKSRSKRTPRTYSNERFRFSKLLVCGQCNSRMFGCCHINNTRRTSRYCCGTYKVFGPTYCNCNSITETALLGHISSAVQSTLSIPGRIQELLLLQDLVADTHRAIAVKAVTARLWKVIAALEQGTVSHVRSLLRETFDHIVLNFDQRHHKKLVRCRLSSGEVFVRVPEGSTPASMLRLSFVV